MMAAKSYLRIVGEVLLPFVVIVVVVLSGLVARDLLSHTYPIRKRDFMEQFQHIERGISREEVVKTIKLYSRHDALESSDRFWLLPRGNPWIITQLKLRMSVEYDESGSVTKVHFADL